MARKITMACGGALALLSIAALAQDKPNVAPNKLTVESKRPPLQLNDKQRAAIEQGLVTENTQQKTPPKFEAKVGALIPSLDESRRHAASRWSSRSRRSSPMAMPSSPKSCW